MAVLRNMLSVSGARNTLEKLLRMNGAESNGSVPGGRKLATSIVPSGSTTSRLRTRSAATGAVKRISVIRPHVGATGAHPRTIPAPAADRVAILPWRPMVAHPESSQRDPFGVDSVRGELSGSPPWNGSPLGWLQRERSAEGLQALEVVRAGEDVDVREGSAHGAGYGAVAGIAEQGIEPDHAGGAAGNGFHFQAQNGGFAGVEAITQDQD